MVLDLEELQLQLDECVAQKKKIKFHQRVYVKFNDTEKVNEMNEKLAEFSELEEKLRQQLISSESTQVET